MEKNIDQIDLDISKSENNNVTQNLKFLKVFKDFRKYKYAGNYIDIDDDGIEKVFSILNKYYDDIEGYCDTINTYNSSEIGIKYRKTYQWVSIKNRTMIFFDNYISILSTNPLSEELMEELKDYMISETKKTIDDIHIITTSPNGNINLHPFKVDDKYKNIDIDSNYNDDFKEVYDSTLKKLDSNSVGLYLLHGIHGSGKTTLIRNLIKRTSKKVIFFPPNMVESLSNPSMIPFLMCHTNSIIVIEDAENILKKRSSGGSQGVSNILNISDGILGDCLNFQIICTFNTSKSELDPALLRKGRLIESYEFDKLSLDKTNNLLKKLGKPLSNERMILSDIYNNEDNHFETEYRKVGFRS